MGGGLLLSTAMLGQQQLLPCTETGGRFGCMSALERQEKSRDCVLRCSVQFVLARMQEGKRQLLGMIDLPMAFQTTATGVQRLRDARFVVNSGWAAVDSAATWAAKRLPKRYQCLSLDVIVWRALRLRQLPGALLPLLVNTLNSRFHDGIESGYWARAVGEPQIHGNVVPRRPRYL